MADEKEPTQSSEHIQRSSGFSDFSPLDLCTNIISREGEMYIRQYTLLSTNIAQKSFIQTFISSSSIDIRALCPVSMTTPTSSIVMLVSAMLVARTIFRTPGGGRSNTSLRVSSHHLKYQRCIAKIAKTVRKTVGDLGYSNLMTCDHIFHTSISCACQTDTLSKTTQVGMPSKHVVQYVELLTKIWLVSAGDDLLIMLNLKVPSPFQLNPSNRSLWGTIIGRSCWF